MADSIKINKLEIENVKRIKAVKIEPTKNGLTIVGGNNNQGKTSVLDSIAWALGGDRYKPSNASRDGSTIPPNLHIVAMAIGKVVAKFQKMKRTATGVAVWVNTLDVYKYLGAADITLQTAFGFKYLTNFLGADVVFVTSEVPQNVVIATPLNNMIAYYVDPGDSDFAKAGLEFTTDSETGFIGFHSEGTYSRMISDNYAIMGLRLFCEYLDAIAYISVGESDTQTLGTLNVTSEAGSEAGTTKLTVKEQLMSMRNCWKYKDAAAATAVTYGMDVKNWSKWDGESEIASTATHHITLVECDQNYKAVRSGDVAVTVNPGA